MNPWKSVPFFWYYSALMPTFPTLGTQKIYEILISIKEKKECFWISIICKITMLFTNSFSLSVDNPGRFHSLHNSWNWGIEALSSLIYQIQRERQCDNAIVICLSRAQQVLQERVGASLPKSTLSDLTQVVQNWPWWNDLY